jgi:hypothetical protein
MRTRVSHVVFLFLLLGSTLFAQSPDLVVVINGTKQFHQSWCALVVQAGTHVKVMKRAEAIRKGLTAHDCSSTPGRVVGSDPNTVKVYTQPGDNKYHTATCPKLGAKRTAVTLEEAGKKFWPCPVCHPPIRHPTAKQE